MAKVHSGALYQSSISLAFRVMKFTLIFPRPLRNYPPICAAVLCVFLTFKATAQTVSTNTGTARASATVVANEANPLVVNDESFPLADALIRALRTGGYSIYIRHGAVIPGSIDRRAQGLWWRDCQNTQRLAPEALPRARAIGDALTRQRVNIAELHVSEFCRARDTGVHIGLAAAQATSALNDAITLVPPQNLATLASGIQNLIGQPTAPRTNRMLVGHLLPSTIVHPALSILQEGHSAIFKAEGNGKFSYVTTLSPGQWQWIGKQNIPDTITTIAAAQPVVAPVAAPSVPPMIDPAKELKGLPLLQALRRGGYNLFMRHAQSNVGQDGNLVQTPNWWENCAIQRNISDTGREQAKKVGAAIKSLQVPVDSVVASQFCRNRDTAHLMDLGPIEVTEDINHQIGQRAGFDVSASRFKRLATPPNKGSNTLLISHTHGSPKNEERIMGGLQEAEIVVYLPDGKGGSEPIARIPPAEWDALAKLAAPSK